LSLAIHHAPGQFGDDPPVRPGLRRWTQGCMDGLQPAGEIDETAVGFSKAGGRQHHFCQRRGIGHKQILDHQEGDPCQGLASRQISVAIMGRVGPHDPHPFQAAIPFCRQHASKVQPFHG
jgi:hypothetical protein